MEGQRTLLANEYVQAYQKVVGMQEAIKALQLSLTEATNELREAEFALLHVVPGTDDVIVMADCCPNTGVRIHNLRCSAEMVKVL